MNTNTKYNKLKLLIKEEIVQKFINTYDNSLDYAKDVYEAKGYEVPIVGGSMPIHSECMKKCLEYWHNNMESPDAEDNCSELVNSYNQGLRDLDENEANEECEICGAKLKDNPNNVPSSNQMNAINNVTESDNKYSQLKNIIKEEYAKKREFEFEVYKKIVNQKETIALQQLKTKYDPKKYEFEYVGENVPYRNY